MNTETFPLRVTRGTTGTVHAARETEVQIRDYSQAGVVYTGETETRIVKACGFDANTLRRVAGTTGTDETAEITCSKCSKAVAR